MTTNSRLPRWISLALLILGGALGVAFVGSDTDIPVASRAPRDENVLRVIFTQNLQPDPVVRGVPLSSYNLFIQSLWEPLVECDPLTGVPKPAAAASWSWSPDFRVLTLKLRPDAHWTNGEPVVAQDFVRGWLRVLRTRVDVAQTLFPLVGAEAYHRGARDKPEAVGVHALDDLTLQVELAQPRTSFVAELADPLLSPLHASTEAVLHLDPTALVTNGPFCLTEANADGWRLLASKTYHGRSEVRLAGLRFIRANGPTLGALMVAAGVADLLPEIGALPDYTWPTQRPMVVEAELALGVTSVNLNVLRGPLRDVRVRQAMALALNRAELIEYSDRTRLVPALSWVPDMPGRPGLELFHENPAEARRLLADAGYPGGRGFPILRMSLPLWMEGDPRPAACSDRWFQELGIRVYVTYEAPADRRVRLSAGDYDIVLSTFVATVADPADLLSTFSWPQEFSESKWRDEEAVRLLAAANHKVGPERLALIEAAERRVMAAAAALPLLFQRRQSLHSTELRGWYADPLARQATKRLWLAPPAATSAARPAPGT